MIKDSYIADQFRKMHSNAYNGLQQISPFEAQLDFGLNANSWDNMPYEAGCNAFQHQFKLKNTIPRYCFECYKIEVFPKTVLELFKLLFVFEKIYFKKNNHRKLWLRPNKTIEANYTGTFYFQSLEEAKNSFEYIKSYIKDQTSIEMPIRLKRGCSNYLNVLPKFYDINENYDSLVRDKKSWEKIEVDFKKNYLKNPLPPLPKEGSCRMVKDFNLKEISILFTWLGFAVTIDDKSYKKITQISSSELKQFIPTIFLKFIL